jgi:inhibitor of KinA
MNVRCQACGDRMILIEFGNAISPAVHALVQRFMKALEQARIPGIAEWVPSYCSVGVVYDPLQIGYQSLAAKLQELAGLEEPMLAAAPGRRVAIPVCYGADLGPDLSFVAAQHGLTERQVVDLHVGAIYRVYLIGFTPGFPYLGGLPPELNTPRRDSPRDRVPAGSVAIGGQQTGIYPVESPGGWHIVGRTPLKLFDLDRPSLSLLEAGDEVVFQTISRREFDTWGLGQHS